ncbi:MAG: flippase-like domain-containing protein [Clostridia bacterium]|nr:flippase-like domain-containing protein [Clostridia bacterium]
MNEEPIGEGEEKIPAVPEQPVQNTEQKASPTQKPIVGKEAKKAEKAVKDAELSARYHATKQKDFEKLAKEIEEKQNRDDKKKRKKWWIKTILMLALIAVSIAIMFTMTQYLTGDGMKSFKEMIKGASLPYFFAFVGMVLLYMLVESAKYSYLLKISTGKWRIRNSIKTMYIGKYYDGITPLGTGGQPFQIYYLHKKDIPVGVATAIPLVRFIVSTVIWCLIAIGMFVIVGMNGWLDNMASGWGGKVVLIVSIIAMAFNLLVPVVMLFVSLFPRAGKKLIAGIVVFLNKLHIVKRKYPTMKKYVYEAREYRESMKIIFTKWYKLIPLALLAVAETAVYMVLPYFAVLALAGPNVTTDHWLLLLQIMCLTMVSFYSASFIPTPGNSGASEAMTTLVFLTVTGINSILGWVILLWRFATFYVYILTGIGISIFEIIRSAVRNKRARKKEARKTQ